MRAGPTVILAALVVAVAGAAHAAPAKRPANPSFSVTVRSTFVHRHVLHLATKPQANGCVFHTDADATSRVTTTLPQPVVLTYRQLRRGVKPFALLKAREQRGGYYTYGYQDGCPNLATTPRFVADRSTCGTRPFDVGSGNVALGYIGGTNDFRFTYTYNSRDPFGGHCVHEVFATDDIGDAGALSFSVPPGVWTNAKPQQPWWTTVDPKRLLAGKKVVVTFKHSGTVVNPDPSGSPGAYDVAQASDTYSVAWTVTLTPVRR